MALSDTQKYKILYHLGYPAKLLVVGSTDYNSVIADKFENLPAEVEAIIADSLQCAEDIKEKISCAQDEISAKRVKDIEINTDVLDQLWKEYKRCMDDMAALLDLPNRNGTSRNVSVCF